jgi:GH25 family lysozyme M1 (1,4-beta-N-acetylmuramidase)
MKKLLFFSSMLIVFCHSANAQECLSSGFCTNITNEHQYPAATFSTTSSTWTTVSAYMNADNYTLFDVTSGNTYEWTYCEDYGGVSANWDAQLTLSDNGSGTNLCFSDNYCGTNGDAPYISWTAAFTGVVMLLTSENNCLDNSGSPYNTLVWRMANGSASTQILGIDISHYQTVTSWSQVQTSGVVFAWAKSTEGVTYDDPDFANSITNGESAGVKMGAYHFARPDNNAAADEAQHFINVAGPYIASCELTPVLDFETTTGCTYAYLTTWAEDWMSAVELATGITPVLYTDGSIASSLGSGVNIYPLWIADPDGSSTAPPTNIGVWSDWVFKQYSWTGVVPGITGDVDMDVFNGDMDAFNNFIGCSTVSISEKNFNIDFILYPNPASDNITIENTSLNDNKEEMILIYNIQGQLLLQQNLQQQKTEIGISDFSDGMYFVKVKTDKGVEVKKFVKE